VVKRRRRAAGVLGTAFFIIGVRSHVGAGIVVINL
jgi:hypothetical protein